MLNLLLKGANGLRTAEKSLSVVADFFGMAQDMPSWDSGRLWLMRIGYYKLHRAKTQAEDWIWIIDFSVQLGKEKCLVILGIRQSDLPAEGQALRHQDMEPIALEPVVQANGAVVYQKLEEAVTKTGVPRAIVSDRGTDVNAGIKQFCQAHRETTAIYDVKHKIALLLKHRLEPDPCWQEFCTYANHLKKQLQQTEYSHLTPPALRTKARYMNLEERIKWGQRIFAVLAKSSDEGVKTKFAGLEKYRRVVDEWAEMHTVVKTVEQFVSQHGLSQETPLKLALHFWQQPRLQHSANRQLRHELLRFMRTQAAQCSFKERLPGSSEVIESVFGKQKYLQGEQSKSGFTGLILAIPAMVAKLDVDIVRLALTSTPVKLVLEWTQKQLGYSIQAKRRQLSAAFK